MDNDRDISRDRGGGPAGSLSSVWEMLELWWYAWLGRLLARGECVPLCPCCEARVREVGAMPGLREWPDSPWAAYLAAAPELGGHARRWLAKRVIASIRSVRAWGWAWLGVAARVGSRSVRWIDCVSGIARGRATSAMAVGVKTRGPPGSSYIIEFVIPASAGMTGRRVGLMASLWPQGRRAFGCVVVSPVYLPVCFRSSPRRRGSSLPVWWFSRERRN